MDFVVWEYHKQGYWFYLQFDENTWEKDEYRIIRATWGLENLEYRSIW
jgi:hypothetical protein